MQLQEKTDDDGLALKVSSQISKFVHVNPRPTHTKAPPLVFPNVRKVLINLCQRFLIRERCNPSYHRGKVENLFVGTL